MFSKTNRSDTVAKFVSNMEGLKRGKARATYSIIMHLVLIILLWFASSAGALTPEECKVERRILVNACKPVILRQPPSPFCCERVRITHAECVCPVITPKLASLVDVNYAVKVIQGCGRPVPRHFKCGSITTP
ncbi:hypothetical protein Ancab_038181 [Ancistrocladus abbreviatus]